MPTTAMSLPPLPATDADEIALARLLASLPQRLQRWVAWLRRPQSKWIRLPIGVAMVLGGLLGFLPILGFWMVPVGLILLGEDIPVLRRYTLRALGAAQAWWDRRRGRS